MSPRTRNPVLSICAAIGLAAALVGCASTGGMPGAGVPTSTPAGAPASAPTSPSANASSKASAPAPSAAPSLPSASTASGAAAAVGAQPPGADLPGAGPSVKTPDERRAEADRKLDASLGTFDDQLRKEQARIARDRETRASVRGGGDGSGTGSGSDDGGGADDRGARGRRGDGDVRSDREHRAERGDRRDGDMRSDKSGQGGGATSSGSGGKGPTDVPPGVGSGENDDLVAKQLREAAEKETDPELREKLWKEYQDYKKSVKRN